MEIGFDKQHHNKKLNLFKFPIHKPQPSGYPLAE